MTPTDVMLAWRLGPTAPLSFKGERVHVVGYSCTADRYRPVVVDWVKLAVDDGGSSRIHVWADELALVVLTKGAKHAMAKARREDEAEDKGEAQAGV